MYTGVFGLRFNTLSLGDVITDKLLEKIKHESEKNNLAVSEVLKTRFSNVPLRRYAEITEVVDMVDFYLNSEVSKHLTGQNTAFDGGFSRPY
jgi:3-oxoacyl-[acyl-carrier protein] reductase